MRYRLLQLNNLLFNRLASLIVGLAAHHVLCREDVPVTRLKLRAHCRERFAGQGLESRKRMLPLQPHSRCGCLRGCTLLRFCNAASLFGGLSGSSCRLVVLVPGFEVLKVGSAGCQERIEIATPRYGPLGRGPTQVFAPGDRLRSHRWRGGGCGLGAAHDKFSGGCQCCARSCRR